MFLAVMSIAFSFNQTLHFKLLILLVFEKDAIALKKGALLVPLVPQKKCRRGACPCTFNGHGAGKFENELSQNISKQTKYFIC